MTWAHTSTESVQCQIDNDEKEGVTVIAAVDAAGGKLPLTVIGKGTSERCLKRYELPREVRVVFQNQGGPQRTSCTTTCPCCVRNCIPKAR
jgi:hypothetical protein